MSNGIDGLPRVHDASEYRLAVQQNHLLKQIVTATGPDELDPHAHDSLLAIQAKNNYRLKRVELAAADAQALLPRDGSRPMIGDLVLALPPTANMHATPKYWVEEQDLLLLPLDGTRDMTGDLVLARGPSLDMHAVNMRWVLDLIAPLAAGLIYMGSYDPVNDLVTYKASSGIPPGPLPPAATFDIGTYLTVIRHGTPSNPNTPALEMRVGDQLINDGTLWDLLPVGLDDIDLIPYLRTDGTRPMTGDLICEASLRVNHATGGVYIDAQDGIQLRPGTGVISRLDFLGTNGRIFFNLLARSAYFDASVAGVALIMESTLAWLVAPDGSVQLTRPLCLTDPVLANELTRKSYVDSAIAAIDWVTFLNPLLPRDGSRPMTGDLVLAGAPTQDLHATTKAYVDSEVDAVNINNYSILQTAFQVGNPLDRFIVNVDTTAWMQPGWPVVIPDRALFQVSQILSKQRIELTQAPMASIAPPGTPVGVGSFIFLTAAHIPSGGNPGQALVKASTWHYDLTWGDVVAKAGDTMTGTLIIRAGAYEQRIVQLELFGGGRAGAPLNGLQIALGSQGGGRPQWISSTTDVGGGAGIDGESILFFNNNHSGGTFPDNALFSGAISNGQILAPNGTRTNPGFAFTVGNFVGRDAARNIGFYNALNNEVGISGHLAFLSGAQYLRFWHANQNDNNDGKLGARLFARGLNIIGVATERPTDTNRYVSLWGNVEIQQNGYMAVSGENTGFRLSPDGGAGSLRYQSGYLYLQQGSNNTQPRIRNFDGSNPRDIIDTVNGDARYVRKVAANANGDMGYGLSLYMHYAMVLQWANGGNPPSLPANVNGIGNQDGQYTGTVYLPATNYVPNGEPFFFYRSSQYGVTINNARTSMAAPYSQGYGVVVFVKNGTTNLYDFVAEIPQGLMPQQLKHNSFGNSYVWPANRGVNSAYMRTDANGNVYWTTTTTAEEEASRAQAELKDKVRGLETELSELKTRLSAPDERYAPRYRMGYKVAWEWPNGDSLRFGPVRRSIFQRTYPLANTGMRLIRLDFKATVDGLQVPTLIELVWQERSDGACARKILNNSETFFATFYGEFRDSVSVTLNAVASGDVRFYDATNAHDRCEVTVTDCGPTSRPTLGARLTPQPLETK